MTCDAAAALVMCTSASKVCTEWVARSWHGSEHELLDSFKFRYASWSPDTHTSAVVLIANPPAPSEILVTFNALTALCHFGQLLRLRSRTVYTEVDCVSLAARDADVKLFLLHSAIQFS
jgi:hypothetical protein